MEGLIVGHAGNVDPGEKVSMGAGLALRTATTHPEQEHPTTARIFSPIRRSVGPRRLWWIHKTTEPTLTEAAADDTAAATDTAADDPDDAADGDSPAEETLVEEALATRSRPTRSRRRMKPRTMSLRPCRTSTPQRLHPGTPDHLPDGLWFGFVGYDDGAVEFDLACAGREELFEAGVIGETRCSPTTTS